MRFLHCKRPVSWMIVVCWVLVMLISCKTQPDHVTIPDFRQQAAIFQQRTPTGYELYLWPLQESTPQKIITLPFNERYELAPDGLRLAVYFGENLRIIDLITFEETILAENIIFPTIFIENINHQFLSWSPEGDKLAVLMGGPSWQDASATSTKVVIFDIKQQSPDFVFDNGTLINEVAWSADSTLISFPEIRAPCYYAESCLQDEEDVLWNLTTLIHSSSLSENPASGSEYNVN